MEHLQCLSFVPSKAKKKKKEDRNKIQVCFDLANKLLFPIISGITFCWCLFLSSMLCSSFLHLVLPNGSYQSNIIQIRLPSTRNVFRKLAF